MSMPIRQGGDSNPTMTIKLARPHASPHWISKCSVLPAMFKGLPWAPWTVPSYCFRAPHWVRLRHQTSNPRQVTEAPVSTNPRTGMPSIVSCLKWVALPFTQSRPPWVWATLPGSVPWVALWRVPAPVATACAATEFGQDSCMPRGLPRHRGSTAVAFCLIAVFAPRKYGAPSSPELKY